MDIINETQFRDLFNMSQEQTTEEALGSKLGAKFGASEPNADIFNKPAEPAVTTTEAATEPETETEPVTGKEVLEEADILSTGKEEETPQFSDMSGYFEDRFNTGKFVKIEEEDAEGNKKIFIPKTPDEFDEVIEIQVNHRVEERLKEADEQWYTSKSPAWQMVAKYAEMADTPEEILPFIQGVKTFNSVASLDPEDIQQAEKIVRERLSQRGDDEEVIEETVDSLKTTDKLISTAQKYKPLILAQEKQRLAAMVAQQKQEEREYHELVTNIRENAIKAIETPLLGSIKLKQDEKAAIYDLIAEPSKETKGYGIYTEIDSLFEKGDFETLRQIALLLTKKDAFLGYIGENASTKTAQGLQKKLRVASESNSSGKDQLTGEKPVQRNQYTQTSRFGR